MITDIKGQIMQVINVLVTVVTLSMCVCTIFTHKRIPSVWSHAPTICTWVGNDLYYIAPYDINLLLKLNVYTGAVDTIGGLGIRSNGSITTFEYSDADSCLYYVTIPINPFFWTGFYGVTIFGIWMGYDAYYDYLRKSLLNSNIMKYHLTRKKTDLLQEINGECESICVAPYNENIILNAVFWDTFTTKNAEPQYVFGFQMDSTVIYIYNTKNKQCDTLSNYIGTGFWAIDYLPDSSLLVIKPHSVESVYKFFKIKKNHEMHYLSCMNMNSHAIYDFRSLKLLPQTAIITWFDWHQQVIYMYDINTGKSDTISALCNSYCFSQDGSKIAYFIYHGEPRRLMIEIQSIKTCQFDNN